MPDTVITALVAGACGIIGASNLVQGTFII